MTQLQVQVSIADNRSLIKKLTDVVASVLRKKFRDAQQRTVDEVDKAVRQSRVEFIPSDDEAGELGVGEGGKLSKKIDLAWEGLLASQNAATIVNVTKGNGENKIGEISVRIDWDLFYKLDDSIINASDSDIGEIPWMKWYIEGQTITGSRFKAGDFNFPPSRTGDGIMIPGTLWQMPPHPIGPAELNDRIIAGISKLAEKLAKGR